MKSFLLILTSLVVFNFSSRAQDLVITGAIDASLTGGLPKAVEFYVINDIADLSIYGVGSANNGNPSMGLEYNFPAEAATAGDFIYLTTGLAEFRTWFGFEATYEDTSSATNINGDDVIELFMNGTLVDAIGNAGERPGPDEDWNFLDGWIYRNDNTGPSATFNIADWSLSGSNALDGFTTNDEAGEDKFPVGSYVRSASTGLRLNSSLIASSIYPNPSKNGVYNMSFARNHQGLTVKVFNLVGDLVYYEEIEKNKREGVIRITDLVNGTYFLQVTDNFKNKESYRLLKW